jgi:hypothetical protein
MAVQLKISTECASGNPVSSTPLAANDLSDQVLCRGGRPIWPTQRTRRSACRATVLCDLVVNLKTAKAIELAIPEFFPLRADREASQPSHH